MSGHSKWAQIKHKKAASDAKKGNLFSKLSRMITVTAKGGSDPATNASLRVAIEKARGFSLPQHNIERAIQKAEEKKSGEGLEEVLYEAYGPGGSALLIEGITDNKNRTTAEIKHLLSEYDGKLAEKGTVLWLFERVAVLEIARDTKKSAEDIELALIDAGVNDTATEEEIVYGFFAPDTLENTKEKLGASGFPIKDAYCAWREKNQMSLAENQKEKFIKLMEALDAHDDVQEVYTNIN
ncbi:MAG: YebC/PmpR family DNA-binding transcriptional regulator [bacterium]|nr:YebC/PmpR family DNA-binding transcriptional regulator [bacterium]